MADNNLATTGSTSVQPRQEAPVKAFFARADIKQKFEELLGKNAPGFIVSVLQIVTASKKLQEADALTIYTAACTAAVLKLPINNNLGFAWIVPYKGQAQFQLGWKGFVQLAQRTGQYTRLNVVEVYANQFKYYNTLAEELNADFSIEGSGDIVGYCAYFKLINGFEKVVYWSKAKVERHAKKYSIAYRSGYDTPWKDQELYHEMAKKTVLKNMLSKWGILSIEMERALITDQAVIHDPDAMQVTYPDNDKAGLPVTDNMEVIKGLLEHPKLDPLLKATVGSALEALAESPETQISTLEAMQKSIEHNGEQQN